MKGFKCIFCDLTTFPTKILWLHTFREICFNIRGTVIVWNFLKIKLHAWKSMQCLLFNHISNSYLIATRSKKSLYLSCLGTVKVWNFFEIKLHMLHVTIIVPFVSEQHLQLWFQNSTFLESINADYKLPRTNKFGETEKVRIMPD